MSNLDAKKKGHRQRLRENFTNATAYSQSDEALLELLLTYAIPQKDLQPLARHLLIEHGSLSSLLETPMETLCQYEGVKEYTAILLKVVDFIRRHHPIDYTTRDVSGKPVTQVALFDHPVESSEPIPLWSTETKTKKRPTHREARFFGKAMLKEAIQILPHLPDTDSYDEISDFLRKNLNFSAEQTRKRNTSYIMSRMFPDGYADAPLRLFAKSFINTQELRDVCFYRFLVAEPLEVEVIEKLLIPNLGTGRLIREQVKNWLADKYPESKSITDYCQAILGALTAAGIAKKDLKGISFSYREIPVTSFAFILYSEFPDPGMYDIQKIYENRMIRAMLWNPDRLLHTLYELRNRGWISKLSEIDSFRQFTTKHTLREVVDIFLSGGKKP